MIEKMSRLEAYAFHGSCSYGGITPERLKEILLSERPVSDVEWPSVAQALLETPATGLYRNPAAELAEELGITLVQLEVRCVELTGERLGSSSPGELARQAAAQEKDTTG